MRKVTKEYIKEVFDECNRLYFDNQLKNCKFTTFRTQSRSKGFVNMKNVKGKIHGRMGIATNVLWTEDSFKEIVIHEMIHLYNEQIEHKHCAIIGHSWHFRRKLKQLNKKHGMKMTITHHNVYIVNEKIPSTFFGKLMRRIKIELAL